MSQIDLAVIGAGPGGYVAAIKAAQLGKKVVLIEKGHVGGTCLNTGCIPSKSYLKHADWLMTIKQAEQFGIEHQLKAIHFDKLVARKNKVVQSLQQGIQHLLIKNGIVYIEGEATLTGKRVSVGQQTFEANYVLLATGSTPFVPPITGIENVAYHTTDTFFELTTLPKKLVIIGGGVIAVELAFAMAALHVEVTIVEVAQEILLTEDPDVRHLLREKLKSLNITVKTAVEIVEVTSNAVKTATEMIAFDELLIATGRQANLKVARQLGLVLENDRFIKVNEHYETSLAGVYAIGDAIGGLMLAHVASAEGIYTVCKLFHHTAAVRVDASRIPKCMYTSPEVASFGLSEEQAKQFGYDVKVKKTPYSQLGKAIATAETEGFVKIITESKYNEILGAVIVGAHATEMIHTILAVKQAEGCIDQLAEMTFGHPTLSELIGEVANSLMAKAIHE